MRILNLICFAVTFAALSHVASAAMSDEARVACKKIDAQIARLNTTIADRIDQLPPLKTEVTQLREKFNQARNDANRARLQVALQNHETKLQSCEDTIAESRKKIAALLVERRALSGAIAESKVAAVGKTEPKGTRKPVNLKPEPKVKVPWVKDDEFDYDEVTITPVGPDIGEALRESMRQKK